MNSSSFNGDKGTLIMIQPSTNIEKIANAIPQWKKRETLPQFLSLFRSIFILLAYAFDFQTNLDVITNHR